MGSDNPNNMQKTWIITKVMDHYENISYQQEQGAMTNGTWKRWKHHIINVFKHAHVREQWLTAKMAYYRPFREIIDQALRENS